MAAQTQQPVIVVNLADLTGRRRRVRDQLHNGVQLAFKEINAGGGILGQRIQLVTFDTQTNADMAQGAGAEGRRAAPFAVIGPVFSSMTLATMDVHARRADSDVHGR